MRKASNILYMIGIVMALLNLTALVVMSFATFSIASPGYTSTLISQLESGAVTTDFPGTYAEQAAQLQKMFLVFAIILTVFTVIGAAKFVLSITAKRSQDKRFNIVSLVLGALSLDVLIVLASILALVALKEEREVEVINASI